MDTLRICAQCQAPLPADTVGMICPKCRQNSAGVISSPPPQPPRGPPPAAQIAEYFPQLEIYEVLGHGGMGMVYKARQLNLDRLVALKILSPELSSQPAFAERFSREAKALARLHHSNIVAVYDFGRAGPYYYFLMEYVDGVDLHTLIQQKELKPPEAFRIVVEVCRALQFAHDEGIIHRDIKPANILIDKKGRVKMADFGLAKLIANDGRRLADLTQTTGLMGTPQYMAPEQIERPSEVDSRADLYSLGVIFYEMLTGELPLGRFPPPSQKARTDVKLDQVVLRALEKEPGLRYQQAAEIQTQVEKFSAPGVASARGRAMTSLLQFGIAGALVLIAALSYALLRDWERPRAAPGVVIVTNTVTVTNNVGRGGFNRNQWLTNTPEGLGVTRRFFTSAQVNPEQIPAVNNIIRAAGRDFLQMERNHTDRLVDAAGHVHVTIRPFLPEEAAGMGEKMWKDLGEVLTPAQVSAARNTPLERVLFPVNPIRATNLVEMWRDSSGIYHYVDILAPARGGGTTNNSSGPNFNATVPQRFWQYWNENNP